VGVVPVAVELLECLDSEIRSKEMQRFRVKREERAVYPSSWQRDRQRVHWDLKE
jgi:hypothetical protein